MGGISFFSKHWPLASDLLNKIRKVLSREDKQFFTKTIVDFQFDNIIYNFIFRYIDINIIIYK